MSNDHHAGVPQDSVDCFDDFFLAADPLEALNLALLLTLTALPVFKPQHLNIVSLHGLSQNGHLSPSM